MESRKLVFMILVTMQCNFQCLYCYEGKTKMNKMMDKCSADAVIHFIQKNDKLSDIDEVEIVFHGGEPLLNFNIIKYIVKKINSSKLAQNKFVHYHMTTNGYLLNDEIIDFIKTYIDDISVSMDGKKNTNDKWRIDVAGNGTYDIVMKKSQKLLQNQPNIAVRMTVNVADLHALVDNILHFVDKGFKKIIPVINIWDKKWKRDDIEYLGEINEKIKELNNMNPNVKISLLINKKTNKILKCSGGKESFCIDAFGEIFPCIYSVGDKALSCGNVFEGLNQLAINKIEKIKKIHVIECQGCSYYDCCESVRCKFINKKYNGRYDVPIPLICNI